MKLRYYSVACGLEYIEIPKCASTSIKIALAASDQVDVTAFPHADRRWRQCPGSFVPCCTFTFVRNPISRLVSAWREKVQTGKGKKLGRPCSLPESATFEEFAKWVVEQDPDQLDKHWKLQSAILHKEYPCDFVGKLEALESDWRQLQNGYGVPQLSLRNPSPDKTPFVIADGLLQQIKNFYREDFLQFGYEL